MQTYAERLLTYALRAECRPNEQREGFKEALAKEQAAAERSARKGSAARAAAGLISRAVS
jgi:hypothetical protein